MRYCGTCGAEIGHLTGHVCIRPQSKTWSATYWPDEVAALRAAIAKRDELLRRIVDAWKDDGCGGLLDDAIEAAETLLAEGKG